ncbi:zinc finger CCHC domain-containing protein 8 homolog [Culicoides brevitarsis]|uniref:zinc finger CCHC domain-containing protein 8 homolog n=1 Tax=Culicoides brevitarsis TaxID=469753 RepID=UPI00307C1B95
MTEEEKNLTKQLFTVTFNQKEHFEKVKDSFGITLKEFLRGHDFKSVQIYTNNENHTISATYSETIDEDECFQIDSTPCPVPIAYVKYETTINLVSSAAQKDLNDAAPPGAGRNACFNCGNDDHSVRECPEPRDGKRISKARQSLSKKVERYHLNVDQKYDAFKPGVISDELRAALGLRSRELPIHIYKMRQLGYPPGWLEEAKTTDSGLAMFTSHKNHKEEGENDDDEDEAIYDPSQIIDFPGFNTCRGDFIDDSRRYDLPRMHPMHEKQFFISRLRKKKPKKDADTQEIDMEESPPGSPTLDDLRNEQKKLIEELGTAIETEKNENSEENNSQNLSEDQYEVIDEVLESSQTSGEADTSLTTRSNTLSIAQGTPILKSCSKYDRLPTGDVWREGVSEVIDFENLPNSTGKYEQMKDVISKVRKRLNK